LHENRGGERFADLGGLEALKTFCNRALSRTALADCPGPFVRDMKRSYENAKAADRTVVTSGM